MQGNYHLFFYDGTGRQLGHAFGPIPQIGFLVEIEPEPRMKRDLLVTGVKLHAGNIEATDAPTISTVTVYCRVEADQLALTYNSAELDTPAIVRRGVATVNERMVGAHSNN